MNLNRCKATQMGILGLLLSSTACGSNSEEPSPAKLDQTMEQTMQEPKNEKQRAPQGDQLTLQVNGAISDLSNKLGVAKESIQVMDARIVQWGSGALGCPEEGKNYTQSIVSGVLVGLQVNGDYHRYHGRLQGSLVYCPADRAKPPSMGRGQQFM